MKYAVLIILQVIFLNTLKSQTIYYLDSKFIKVEKSLSKYIATQWITNDTINECILTSNKRDSVFNIRYVKDNTKVFYQKEYYMTGMPKKAGWYIYNKKNGIWNFYDDWGNIYVTKTFKNDVEKGIRKRYYFNGGIKCEEFIFDGSVNGYFKEYHKNGILSLEGEKIEDEPNGVILKYNTKGQLASRSFYVLGLKEGHDSIFNHETLVKIFTYKKGKRNGPVYYYKNDKLVATDYYKNNKLIGKSKYVEPSVIDSSINLPFLSVKEMPMFKYGENDMMEFVAENLVYPEEAKINGIEGIVRLRFVVDTNGRIKDIEFISEFLGYGCDKAAYNVIAAMPDWTPGKQNGNAVPVYFIMPIRFKLY